MRTVLVVALACAALAGPGSAQDSGAKWRIHEWGTFTSLVSETGAPIGWINTEDEPVPDFVHRLRKSLLIPIDDIAPVFDKGAPRAHPDVLVRLETPVVYFHPPKGIRLPATVDLRVDFRGGWLTEYYPDGKSVAPGLDPRDGFFGRINPNASGSLEWKGLRVGQAGAFPETRDAVWLAPRDVRAAPVTAPNGECERFLFYRGVGHLSPPITTVFGGGGKTVSVYSRWPEDLNRPHSLRVPNLWLVDIREDGSAAYRALPALTFRRADTSALATFPATFAPEEYSLARLLALRKEMRQGLTDDGLYADEADALLNTWQASYFQSPGLRLFFVVPKAWTNHVLPLKVSVPAEVTRSMIGRLELVTPGQRACLQRLALAKECSTNWYFEWLEKNPEAAKRFQQRRREGDLQSLRRDCVTIPDNYLAYLQLGRFRNALVLDEYRRTGARSLQAFIQTYDLAPARVPPR
jgi:hypothetical protein